MVLTDRIRRPKGPVLRFLTVWTVPRLAVSGGSGSFRLLALLFPERWFTLTWSPSRAEAPPARPATLAVIFACRFMISITQIIVSLDCRLSNLNKPGVFVISSTLCAVDGSVALVSEYGARLGPVHVLLEASMTPKKENLWSGMAVAADQTFGALPNCANGWLRTLPSLLTVRRCWARASKPLLDREDRSVTVMKRWKGF